MGFLVIVSATVWPTAAIVLCGLAGAICTLQYLIYGLHSVWCFVQRMLRAIRNGVVRLCACVFGESTSPASATDSLANSPPPLKVALPPPTHLSNIATKEVPDRPPRNPARITTI